MPNHIHAILMIENHISNNSFVEDNDRCPLQTKHNRNMELLPKIISQFKSSVTRTIRKQFCDYKFSWKPSHHDHIWIRDELALQKIREYIKSNPLRWDTDEYF